MNEEKKVKGINIDGKRFVFFCQHCQEFHRHGTGSSVGSPRKRDYGHRVAHCMKSGSPYKESGYHLVGFTKMELKEMKKWCEEALSHGNIVN